VEERATLASTSQDGRAMRRFWLMGGALLLTLLLGVLLAARPADASTRIQIRCTVYDMNRVDPIFPLTEHLHHHFGNLNTEDNSTGARLKELGSTSCDKPWFTSAGWFPVARDPGGHFVPLAPRNQVIVYYRNPGGTDLQPIPTGLGLFTKDIKIKSSGDRVTLTFPDCLDPNQLDGNQEALKTVSTTRSRQGNCPSEFDYRIPRVSYVIRYSGTITSLTEVSAGVDAWAPFRTDMHADYLAANQDVFNNQLIDQCLRFGSPGVDPACE
jgi:Domain of unknown function (DUF1996)